MSKLTGKTALVTGASRGIGRGIALRLAKEGATVVVHYVRSEAAAEEVVREIHRSGGTAYALQADLGSVRGVIELYAGLDRLLGGKDMRAAFDILVNNAGIGQASSIEDLTEEALDAVMDLHVKSPLFLIQQGLGRMREGGRIINLSSAVTRIAFPNLLAYSISKGAVDTMTLLLAKHLGRFGITVNAIAPGIVETDMNAATLEDAAGREFASGLSVFGRWADTSDIADIAAFLASPDSRWVTGQVIDASGGSGL